MKRTYQGEMTTGRLVEAVMLFRGMSFEEFANAIGEHPMNVYKLLHGRRRITQEMAVKMAKALNMNPLLILQGCSIEFCNK